MQDAMQNGFHGLKEDQEKNNTKIKNMIEHKLANVIESIMAVVTDKQNADMLQASKMDQATVEATKRKSLSRNTAAGQRKRKTDETKKNKPAKKGGRKKTKVSVYYFLRVA
jgi:hypothetical protein